MSREFWIAEIRASDAVQDKIREKHNVTVEEIRRWCVPVQYEWAGWHRHDLHGWRLLVETRDDQGKLIQVILQPIDENEGIWKLRTAWRIM